MKKFGKMTDKEFKEAIKEILKSDNKKQEKKEKEVEKNFFKELEEFFSEPLTKEVFIRRGKKTKEVIYDIFSTIIFVIVAMIVIRFFLFEMRWIPSGSMKPLFIEGDRVLVDRFSRFIKLPERGDIMIFYPPSEPISKTPLKVFNRLTGIFCDDVAYIKRVIGLPGEKFEIKKDKNGVSQVYINDEPLKEDYVKNPLEYPDCTEEMYCGPFIIPEGNYFMMGDNRGSSLDSRYWGFLPQERFIGKAFFVFRFAKLK